MAIPLGITSSGYTHPKLNVLTGTTDLYSDSTYYYVRFRSSGTFEVQYQKLTVDFWICGGGGGSRGRLANAESWFSADGVKEVAFGPGGAAGGAVNAGNTNFQLWNKELLGGNGTHTVTIGAGGAGASGTGSGNNGTNGTATTLQFPPLLGEPTRSAGAGQTGGFGNAGNGVYSGSGQVERRYYNGIGGFDPYQPWLRNGGGGAGAGGNASNSSNIGFGGPGVTFPWPISADNGGGDYGAGAAGVGGGYIGGLDYWNYYWNNWYPSNQTGGSGGPSAGGVNPTGTGTAAAVNRGGGGGAGWNGGGNGGSGVLWIRYLRGDVGG